MSHFYVNHITSHVKFINNCSLFLFCCSFKPNETIWQMIFFWLHKSRFLKLEKGTAKEEQICRKDAGCWEGTKRNFSKSIRMLNWQYCVASFKASVGWKRIFNSTAEKWEEVLDSQKDAPFFSNRVQQMKQNLLNSPLIKLFLQTQHSGVISRQ